MNFSDFFIKRPVFSTVLNTLILVAGLLAMTRLGVAEYPTVVVPKLTVSATYPNANAEVVEKSLTTVLEDQLSRLSGLELMTSSSSFGSSHITLTFSPDTKVEAAMSALREHLSRVQSTLPKEVTSPRVDKAAEDRTALVYVVLTSQKLPTAELTHFFKQKLEGRFRVIPGVASAKVYGVHHQMKIVPDPVKMLKHGVMLSDISEVLRKASKILPAGVISDAYEVTIDASPHAVRDFENLIVKKNNDSVISLSHVAKVFLDENKDIQARINGIPGLLVGINKSTDGNPLLISKKIKALVENIQADLPKDISISIGSDHSQFIQASLSKIKSTLFEASFLVVLIILLFLGQLRATLVPLLTIPISLVGAFFLMQIFGASINTITLLALVLAIGIVVDDSIVVLENIFSHMEKGLSPWEATRKGSREIFFPVVAMTLTLASVFAPLFFVGGVIGQVFSEFAIALAGAVIISGVVALTLAPALCARLIKTLPRNEGSNGLFTKLGPNYERALTWLLKKPAIPLAALVFCAAGAAHFLYHLEKENTPREDRSLIGVFVNAFPGEADDVILPYIDQIEAKIAAVPEVDNLMFFHGSFGANFMAPLGAPETRDRSGDEIVAGLRKDVQSIPSIGAFPWSFSNGLPGMRASSTGDIKTISVVVQTPYDYEALADVLDNLSETIRKTDAFKEAKGLLDLSKKGYNAKIDYYQMARLGFSPTQIAQAMSMMFQDTPLGKYRMDGQQYNIQMELQNKPENLHEIYLNTAEGDLVSLGSFVTLESKMMPSSLDHTNQLRSAILNATIAEGVSLGDAVAVLKTTLAQNLPVGYQAELTGAVKDREETGNTMAFLILLAIVFIYGILAMQFESFLDPLVILVTVPLAGFGALALLWLTGSTLNIFSQVGLITLIGLIAKHGILLVEFANQRFNKGADKATAIIGAARARLRPIFMTAISTFVGALPLVLTSGAGYEARAAIGYVLLGGMSLGTILTLFLLPSVYVLIKRSPKPLEDQQHG